MDKQGIKEWTHSELTSRTNAMKTNLKQQNTEVAVGPETLGPVLHSLTRYLNMPLKDYVNEMFFTRVTVVVFQMQKKVPFTATSFMKVHNQCSKVTVVVSFL